ncbi:2-dehydro-3-deoxy-D-gluconate 5-dehydrogenase [Psilocybe cubensis]|uniref:2-dehydro-3-deoxy-D-gluconate 5-dehydrogenase n=1 Tax=Psilocybe cubensis TaxID=181762 RepID=A0ACB8GSK8_PSICU|nr:2-dehydro-3-deoxy-D-gluconate 5-dehydrogenase [Psilocybe cubensis]KAH9478412.1 2-dehydro-3-deoxy-D-gluconate 5-dehydrogenase [Psilocybe cubensis]
MLSIPTPTTSVRSIIHFASLLSFQGGLTVPAYAAAKGGIAQLVKAFSNEWSARGVRVNAVVPGYIKTDMNSALLANPTRLRQISERIPAGRWGDPADFAGVVVFLASKASLYVCGELVVVDGPFSRVPSQLPGRTGRGSDLLCIYTTLTELAIDGGPLLRGWMGR